MLSGAACPVMFDTARVNHPNLRPTETSYAAWPVRRSRLVATLRGITRHYPVMTAANNHHDWLAGYAARFFQFRCHALAAPPVTASPAGDRLGIQWERRHG